MRRTAFLVLTLLFAAPGPEASAEIVVGNFSAGELSGWRSRAFRGETSYRLVEDAGRTVLAARSLAAASGLIKEVRIDPRDCPILRWSWKIDHTLRKGDGRTRAGDDYAARIYVVFPRGLFFRTRAINYIWANKLPKGAILPNAYSSSAVMVAVESGNDKSGTWVREERNVYEDYKAIFGEEPPAIGAVALMTDTDDTGEETQAWYGDIAFGPAPGAPRNCPPPAPRD
jgi:hypothetical protein